MEPQLETKSVSDGQELCRLLKRLSEISLRMLPGMMVQEGTRAGLFCRKLRESENGIREQVGTSVRYSLIACLGLTSAFPAKGVEHDSPWKMAQARFSQLLHDEPQEFSLGDLGLLLSLSSRTGGQWTGRALDLLSNRWERENEYLDSMALSWLLMGLVESCAGLSTRSCRSLLEEALTSLLGCYSPASHLFAFARFHRVSFYLHRPYRHVLGSFASQVYPLLALSAYVKIFSDHSLKGVLKECADRVCDLQGPEGEWWWIYDVRDSSVFQHFPVYSVHQDGMAPMALLATMEVLDNQKYADPVARGLRYLFEYNEPRSGQHFINREQDLIWRALMRDLPGEDPADLPFGLSHIEFARMTSVGWRSLLIRRRELPNHGFHFLKETRPYCPGWILFAYSLAIHLFGKDTDLRMDWATTLSQTASIYRDETNH